MNNDLVICGALLAAMGLIAGLAFLSARAHWLLKIGFATALVLTAIYTWTVATDLFGFPVPSPPPDGVTVLSIDANEAKNYIALWVIEKDRPRNYAIPYDPELARKLQDMEGRAMMMHGRMVLRIKEGNGHGLYWNWINPAASSPDNVNIDVVSAIPPKDDK